LTALQHFHGVPHSQLKISRLNLQHLATTPQKVIHCFSFLMHSPVIDRRILSEHNSSTLHARALQNPKKVSALVFARNRPYHGRRKSESLLGVLF
jgi:hypothetical protein